MIELRPLVTSSTGVAMTRMRSKGLKDVVLFLDHMVCTKVCLLFTHIGAEMFLYVPNIFMKKLT